MSYVIAVDVGIKNLGICVFDFITAKVVFWDCVSLVGYGKYYPLHNVEYVRKFVRAHEYYFKNAAKVLIERQMRVNMRIIEAILHNTFYECCIIIAPRSVKLHYDLSTKNYKQNKRKAVEWATLHLENNPKVFTDEALSVWKTGKKRDDLADALLLVMYYLDTYSNQLNIEDERIEIQPVLYL